MAGKSLALYNQLTVAHEFRDAPGPIGQGLSPRLQDNSPATVPD
jgi:hypothetical protein